MGIDFLLYCSIFEIDYEFYLVYLVLVIFCATVLRTVDVPLFQGVKYREVL